MVPATKQCNELFCSNALFALLHRLNSTALCSKRINLIVFCHNEDMVAFDANFDSWQYQNIGELFANFEVVALIKDVVICYGNDIELVIGDMPLYGFYIKVKIIIKRG